MVPTIIFKWSCDNTCGIMNVQQDNAKPHIKLDDAKFVEHARTLDSAFNPQIVPDLNVLYLGFLEQSKLCRRAPRTIDELVGDVEQDFENFHHDKLNKIFLTLQLNMMKIMKAGGDINFKKPVTIINAQVKVSNCN